MILPGDALHGWDQQVAAARLLSALLIAPIPLFVWLTARRMRLSTPAALTATLVPLAIPQLQHVGASVNNDDMLALLAAALTYLVVRIATGDTRTRTLVVAGVVTGLALFTKAFAYVFPFWVLAAVAVGRARQRRRISLRDAAIVLGTAFVSGGWWWARNFLKFGALSPSIDNARFPKAPATFHPNWVHWWHEAFRRVGLTFWGNFGWYDTHIPVIVSVIAWAVLGAALIVAFFAPRPAKRASTSPGGDVPTRAVVLLLLAPLVLVGAEVFLTAGHAYGYSAQIPGLQGRYLFSAVAGLAVIVGIAVAALGRFLPRVVRVFPLLLLAAIVVMHTLSVRAIFGYYWGPATASFTEQVRAFLAWCPWSPFWFWCATIVGVTSIVLMIVYVVRATFASDDALPPTPNGNGRGRVSAARDAVIASA